MKVPSQLKLQKLMKAHMGDKRTLHVKRSSVPLMYLQYLLFMKKLAREADLQAFSQRRRIIRERDVKKAAKNVLRDFSLKERIGARALQQLTSEGEDVVASESDIEEEEATQLGEISESEED